MKEEHHLGKKRYMYMQLITPVNPLTPYIKEQILLSYPHTFLIKVVAEDVVTLGDHILNSHDLRG